jgi:hypothetical protein
MTRMTMALMFAFAGLALAGARTELQAGWGIGVRVGGPVYYGPWAPYYYPYYPYGAVYAAPPPVVVESAPVLVPPPASAPGTLPPAPVPVSGVQPVSQVQAAPPVDINYYLQQLRNPDERGRADTVLQLGRLKAVSCVDPIAATLAGDRSPVVREAAARALALIGSPKALPALQRAAQVDPDRDVRHSAQFAVEVVQSRH